MNKQPLRTTKIHVTLLIGVILLSTNCIVLSECYTTNSDLPSDKSEPNTNTAIKNHEGPSIRIKANNQVHNPAIADNRTIEASNASTICLASSSTKDSLSNDLVSATSDEFVTQLNCAGLTCCVAKSLRANSSTIKVGYLTNFHGRNNKLGQGIVISGAISYAISMVNQNTSRFNGRRIELIANDTEGSTLLGTSSILDQWCRGAVAFFGPEDSCEVEAAVASAINLPMISYKCADSKASNKNFYRTFVRTHPPDTQIVSSVLTLLEHFRWKKFSIISEQSIQYQTVARNLADRAKSLNFTINSESKFENIYSCCVGHKSCCHDALYDIIEDTFERTRIYVFLGTDNDLISMMQVMQVKNLISSGDYLVIYVDLDQYSRFLSYKYLWRLDMNLNTKRTMLEAANSLLVVVSSPPTYSDFEESVRKHNALPPFNLKQPFPELRTHITIYASYLYDAFMLYADALEETIKNGKDIYDGTAIVKRIIERKRYPSITGPWMNIDSNGDVEGNYTVLAIRPIPNDFKTKMFGDLNHTMLPVCNFQYENNTLKLKGTSDWLEVWKPPLDEPICAYDNSLCRKSDSIRGFIAGVQLVIVLILSIIVSQVYRNWEKEQEIAGLLWRMDLEDVQFHSDQLNRAHSRSSFMSQTSSDSVGVRNRKTYTKTATYKGIIVAIKELQLSTRKDKDIPRASMVEMKLLKDLRHDNINQFIGACIVPEMNLIYIVTEYCSKGSLQDILKNSDVKLDAMFISSLLFDLISGLSYLHDSEFKCHGNLKSSNCLITSRWVLKLTDFGLHNFRLKALSAPVQVGMRYAHYRDQLWRAPELLRQPTMLGNQKTDIYSFGIILHEMIARDGPFGIDITSMRPEHVLDSVMYPNRPINEDRSPTSKYRAQHAMARPEHGEVFNQSPLVRGRQSYNREPGGLIQLEHYRQNRSKSSAPSDLTKINIPEDRELDDHIGSETPFIDKVGEQIARDRNQVQAFSGNESSSNQPEMLRLFRPDVNIPNCPKYIIDVMRDCWSEKPECRPDIRTIRRRLESMRQSNQTNIMDNMMAMMEKYANNLEEIVQERTAQLVEEKKKTEVLLYRMLPPSVAGQLMVGEEVEPESFDAVTIFFSDIVGFTEMSSKSTPMEVVVFLNDLYTLFDAVIQEYQVYKVETIGDAYMVVSGLPERIHHHANEIASMAIELLKSVEDFCIRHLPNEILQLRIGLHTGPVVAGVVGTMMPRYCLFGDTVNTASRMESHGEPLKIHTSPRTKDHLDKSGNYVLESRGTIQIKGKGNLETFWLLGHKNETSQYRYDPKSKITHNVGLWDAIGHIEGKKRSPRVVL